MISTHGVLSQGRSNRGTILLDTLIALFVLGIITVVTLKENERLTHFLVQFHRERQAIAEISCLSQGMPQILASGIKEPSIIRQCSDSPEETEISCTEIPKRTSGNSSAGLPNPSGCYSCLIRVPYRTTAHTPISQAWLTVHDTSCNRQLDRFEKVPAYEG